MPDIHGKSRRRLSRYNRRVKKGSRKAVKYRPIRRKLLTYVLFGRALTIAFFIALQFLVLIKIDNLLDTYLFRNYWSAHQSLVSLGFMVYLVNTNKKPEFKLVWMVPVTIAPIFGVLMYLFFSINMGGIGLRKRLRKTTARLLKTLKPLPEVQDSLYQNPSVKDLAFYLQSCGFPAYMDSGAAYFPSGEDNFVDMLVELEKAEKFIFMEYFIIGFGTMWGDILAILKKKAAAGVEVRVMYDGIGSMMLLPSGYPEYLSTLGIKAKTYAPLVPLLSTHQNNRDHRKICVIDGRIAYTGGINLSDEYINVQERFGYWKDCGIRIEGSAVMNFTAMFLQVWNVSEKTDDDWERYLRTDSTPFTHAADTPSGMYADQPVPTAVASSPSYFGGFIIPYGDDGLNDEDTAEIVYCDILNRARWYVHIVTPYLILDSALENALVYAARRGVEVFILVPSRADHYLTFCIGRTYIKRLIENGVHVAEYLPGFIHSKLFVSDGERAVVGSINLDYRSLFHHFECAAYIQGNAVVNDVEQDFKRAKEQCREFTPELYKKIPVHQRMLGRAAKMFDTLL